jgi:predicted ATPase
MRSDLPSGTVTFLFTDVEGSTKLLHELGAERYAEALDEHRGVIREACRGEGGVEVDTQGDAFFFAFPTADGALQAATTFTDGLASGPIRVRVGIHMGTPHLASEGYVGEDVHFAARVASSAHGGQVVLSSAVRGLVDERFMLTDLGEHRLKDITAAVSIFQLGTRAFPPLKTISNTNLPRPASSFVGRERELQEALARIRTGARLLTLTGPGGSGKTRLALEVASELVPEFKAGVFWVGLATLREPALVTETIAHVLGTNDDLGEHIADRELLLLLDNMEQVVEVAPELSALVAACPNLTVLVTSRELLRVQGEVEYAVPPLAEQEAVSLFCARSQLEPDDTIAELCGRLDNLPLAVELAAARAKALSPTKILERIAQRLDLLTGGRDADPRQQTLRTAIEWSYDLLTPGDQALFSRLAVFSGGCTLEAAEEVAEADLDVLQSLVEKSLLRHTDDRYWMLETIREYAAERLQASGPGDLRERHETFFCELAENAEPQLKGARQQYYLDVLEAEHDNLRATFDYCLYEKSEVERAGRLAYALFEFIDIRSHYEEGTRWFDALLARRAEMSPATTAGALVGAAVLAEREGAYGNAARHFREASEIYGSLGEHQGVARASCGLAFALLNLGRSEEGTAAAEHSLSAARTSGDAWTIACALSALAMTKDDTGDADGAEALLWDSHRLFTEVGDRRNAAIVLLNLGGIAAHAGWLDRAESYLADAKAAAENIGDAGQLSGVVASQAENAFRRGALDEARIHSREAIRLNHDLGRRNELARCLLLVALLADGSDAPARMLGAADGVLGDDELAPWDDVGREALRELRILEDDARLSEIVLDWRRRPFSDAVAEALSILDELDSANA